MSQYKMVIDLSKCAGCGACGVACKAGNNTCEGNTAQSFNWADFATKTEGSFPNTKWTAFPTMCNHCVSPHCISICPVAEIADPNCAPTAANPTGGRKAMYKLNDANGGLVLHDAARCVGCGRCQRNCRYSAMDLTAEKKQYSVISKNFKTDDWDDQTQAITDGTGSSAELAAAIGQRPPHRTDWTCTSVKAEGGSEINIPEIKSYRVDKTVSLGKAEKCYMCPHRTLDPANPKLPYCVQACPAAARMIVGPSSLKDDAGVDHTAASYSATVQTRVLSDVPSGVKVLAHGSNKNPVLVEPITIGGGQPQVHYIGKFTKR